MSSLVIQSNYYYIKNRSWNFWSIFDQISYCAQLSRAELAHCLSRLKRARVLWVYVGKKRSLFIDARCVVKRKIQFLVGSTSGW